MLEVLGYVVLALVVVVIGILVYASTRPDAFSIKRSAVITAPAERIFPLIANLKAMNTWNPFVEPIPTSRSRIAAPRLAKAPPTRGVATTRLAKDGSRSPRRRRLHALLFNSTCSNP